MRTDKKIVTYQDLPKLRRKYSRSGKTIVLTMGSFDVLHLGHAVHLNYCKQQGDILVVGLGSDKVISIHKGPSRPIHNQTVRARLVACLEMVDHVVVSEEETPNDAIELSKLLRPNIFVIPKNDSQLNDRKKQFLAIGAKVVVCRRTPPLRIKGGISSSKIIKRLEDR